MRRALAGIAWNKSAAWIQRVSACELRKMIAAPHLTSAVHVTAASAGRPDCQRDCHARRTPRASVELRMQLPCVLLLPYTGFDCALLAERERFTGSVGRASETLLPSWLRVVTGVGSKPPLRRAHRC